MTARQCLNNFHSDTHYYVNKLVGDELIRRPGARHVPPALRLLRAGNAAYRASEQLLLTCLPPSALPACITALLVYRARAEIDSRREREPAARDGKALLRAWIGVGLMKTNFPVFLPPPIPLSRSVNAWSGWLPLVLIRVISFLNTD